MNVPLEKIQTVTEIRRIAIVMLLIGSTILLQACASPAGRLKQFASDQGFTRGKLRTGTFDLLVFDNQATLARAAGLQKKSGSSASSNKVLHIYLEGDGSPWRHRTIVMPDPTPRRPLMLRLMSIDPDLSAYVGRPCYNGTANDSGCNSSLWTSGRYSGSIVQSMATAIRVLSRRLGANEIWLLGHSGGGALAMLLAPEIDQVTRIVTIAGNLDTDAWTDHHNYTPLYSSANPARLPPLRETITQWHLLGARDSTIPPALVKDAIARQATAHRFVLPGYDHGCCWDKLWPRVLEALIDNDPNQIPGYVSPDSESRVRSSGLK